MSELEIMIHLHPDFPIEKEIRFVYNFAGFGCKSRLLGKSITCSVADAMRNPPLQSMDTWLWWFPLRFTHEPYTTVD
jgi:hypothetical protein